MFKMEFYLEYEKQLDDQYVSREARDYIICEKVIHVVRQMEIEPDFGSSAHISTTRRPRTATLSYSSESGPVEFEYERTVFTRPRYGPT